MSSNRNNVLIGIMGWFLILIVPIVSLSQVAISFSNSEEAKFLYLAIGIMSLSCIVIFYFNLYVLIPKFLFTKRFVAYVISSLFCVAIILLLPPLFLIAFSNLPDPIDSNNPFMKIVRPIMFSNIILLFVLSFIGSIGLSINRRLQELEREKLATSLNYLRNQIHPHFLFNTLNGIYSATVKNAPEGADMVDRLANMMRYTLTETKADFVDIDKEIKYIEDYVALQLLRHRNTANVVLDVQSVITSGSIAPMVLISFVENAFKYGINPEKESSIGIRMYTDDSYFIMEVHNSIVAKPHHSETTGIGISNTISRLDLLYASNYSLRLDNKNDVYKVYLKLPIK